MNALVYVNIDQDIHWMKIYSCAKWKMKKKNYLAAWIFSSQNYGKPLISEEWSHHLDFISVCDITDWKWMKIDEQQITSIYNGTHKAKFNQEAIS